MADYLVGKMDPAQDGFTITPSATALAKRTRAVWVGTGGNLNVTFVSGTTVLLTNVPDGTLLPLQLTHVLSTSTTATGIVGLL